MRMVVQLKFGNDIPRSSWDAYKTKFEEAFEKAGITAAFVTTDTSVVLEVVAVSDN